ncbi:MAG: substrate-binding domain-containing protein, partial [Ruminococcus sp.]|nr:substrate-binding domain-containing protein [Ruminococcus sp.]
TAQAEGWTIVEEQTAEWNAEKAQQIVQSAIDSGKTFNVIYAENDDMAKGAVAALDKNNISHGVGKDCIVMGFDCNKWALEELLNKNWNYDGQCNPFQSSYIDDVIKKLEKGEKIEKKTIVMEEKGFDAEKITKEDVDKYGI